MLEGGGAVLVDERTLWPDGKFVTTHVIVRTAFLKEHPELVASFLRAHVRAIELPERGARPGARDRERRESSKLTGKALPAAVIERAWATLHVHGGSDRRLAAQVRRRTPRTVGLLDPVKLDGIYDLAPLNAILAAAGKPPVSD